MSLSFEMKILDVCVSIIFVGKEKPSMYCICYLSECSLSLVGCIKSSSHLRNVLHTNTQINSILWKKTRVFFLRHYFQLCGWIEILFFCKTTMLDIVVFLSLQTNMKARDPYKCNNEFNEYNTSVESAQSFILCHLIWKSFQEQQHFAY